MRGFYVVASSLAAQFFVEWLFTNNGWFSNNASSGSIAAPRLSLFGVDLSSPRGRYLLTASVTAVLFWLSANLLRSQTGRGWTATRDMDTAAAVIGVPDALRGLVVKAFIVLRAEHSVDQAAVEAIQGFVRERLSQHEYPRIIEFVTDLPRTPAGKINRKVLRDQEAARAQHREQA